MSYGNYGNKGQQNNWQNNNQQNNNQNTKYGQNNNQGGYNQNNQNNQQGGDKKQSVGGLWVRKMKNGNDFFSITIDGKRFIAFPNNFKTEDKHPDFKLYEADDNNAGQQQRPQAPNQQQGTYAKQPANNNGYQNNSYGNRPAQGNQSYSAPQASPAPQQSVQQQNAPSVTNEEFDDIPTF